MNLGYSHPILFDIPEGIEIKVEPSIEFDSKYMQIKGWLDRLLQRSADFLSQNPLFG